MLWRGSVPSQLLTKSKETLLDDGQKKRRREVRHERTHSYYGESQHYIPTWTVKSEQELTVDVKQEPRFELEGCRLEVHQPQEPEYIEVKGEPLDSEESTDVYIVEVDALGLS